jgi:hypothetical protein
MLCGRAADAGGGIRIDRRVLGGDLRRGTRVHLASWGQVAWDTEQGQLLEAARVQAMGFSRCTGQRRTRVRRSKGDQQGYADETRRQAGRPGARLQPSAAPE